MSDAPHHSPSGHRAEEPGAAPRPASAADEFWREFAHARSGRRPRSGQADAQAGPSDRASATSEPAGHECLEWCPVCRGADVLRAAGSPVVRGQLASLQRDSLLTLRALIDTYLERGGAGEPDDTRPVEDIPID